jgi:uncharacterized protein
MSITVAQTLQVTLNRNLKMLDSLLDKAAESAQARNFDVGVLLGARLAPDMFPLTRQVQIATDTAKGMAGRLAGRELPVFEDVETTLPELKERIARTIAFVNSIGEQDYAGAEQRAITIPTRAAELKFEGLDYLIAFALPNFYFHVTAVYLILRHNGVELGKKNFLGLG